MDEYYQDNKANNDHPFPKGMGDHFQYEIKILKRSRRSK
jgi:hypothetical protein